MLLQTITPTLAAGLGLAREQGMIVADVMPGGSAEAAGIEVGDVIDTVDGWPVDSLLPLAMRLFTSDGGECLALGLVRRGRAFTVDVAVVARDGDDDRLIDLVDPDTSFIPSLGILGVGITESVAALVPPLRSASGVIVAARAPQRATMDVALAAGDVIHTVNGVVVGTLDALRGALGAVKPHAPVVLQIERNGQLTFLAFEAD